MAFTGLTSSDYGRRPVAAAGLLYGTGPRDISSRLNTGSDIAQVSTVSLDAVVSSEIDAYVVIVSAASNDENYSCSILVEGQAEQTASITSDGTATTQEIRDALKAAVDGLGLAVTTADISTNQFSVVANVPGVNIEVSVTADSPGDMSVLHNANSVDASYSISVDGVEISYRPDDTATEAEINAGLLAAAAADAHFTALMTAAQGADTSEIVLTGAVAGQSYDVSVGNNASASAISVTTTTAPIDIQTIPFGSGTVRSSSNEDACRLPHLSSDVLEGVSVREHAVDAGLSIVTGYPANEAANILRRGMIWVPVEGSPSPGDNVYCRFTDGAGGTVKGVFRTDSDSSTALQAPSSWSWERSAVGGFALLKVA